MAYAFDLISKDRSAKICLETLDGVFSFSSGRWVCNRRAGVWVSATQSELSEIAENPNWQLYEEPAAEVEVFEWRYRFKGEKVWYLAGLADEDVDGWFDKTPHEREKTGRTWKVKP